MSIRWLQISSWKQTNPILPYPVPSPPLLRRWLVQDSGGAVGLGIVAALNNSSKSNSQVKPTVCTAPVPINSSTPAGYREKSRQHSHKNHRRMVEGLFRESSTRSSNNDIIVSDFLSNCCLCKKRLHGKDVYMYREKGFCSMDCRDQQIVSDEMQEKCRWSKTSDISCSPCSAGDPSSLLLKVKRSPGRKTICS